MAKKSYKEELINSIEPNFIFNKKALNRFKFSQFKSASNNLSKNNQLLEYP